MEDFKIVFVEIDIIDKKKIESILKVFKLTFSDVIIKDLEFDNIGDKYLVSFQISSKYYKTIIEKLTLNKIKVLTDDPEAESAIDHAQSRLNKRETRGFDGWDTLARVGKPKRNAPVKLIAEEGDYLELIRIINDLTGPAERREEASSLLKDAVNIAIQKLYEQSLINPRTTENVIDELLSIASNGFLKATGLNSLTEHAAQIAMDIAMSDPKYYAKLVLIGNDRYLSPVINLKAVVNFAKKTFEDRQKYRQQIKFAYQFSNLKHLVKVYEVAKKYLTNEERKILKNFVTYINAARTKV